MAAYETTLDIKFDILFRAGEKTDGSSDWDARAMDYIQRAYSAIVQGGQEFDQEVNEDWLWLFRTGVLTLLPAISKSATFTIGSTLLTFDTFPVDDTNTAIPVVGYFVRPSGVGDVFKVTAHSVGQVNATMDSPFTGTSGVYNCDVFLLVYTLADDVMRTRSNMWTRPLNFGFPWRPSQISIVETEVVRTMWPISRVTSGVPTMCSMTDESHVQFNTFPADRVRVEYDYLFLPDVLTGDAGETPVLPYKDRRVLADMALYFLFQDKNDNRADATALVAKGGIRGMARENHARMAAGDRTLGHLYPRMDRLSRSNVPLRTSGGLVVG